jgi:hypothetical protein
MGRLESRPVRKSAVPIALRGRISYAAAAATLGRGLEVLPKVARAGPG